MRAATLVAVLATATFAGEPQVTSRSAKGRKPFLTPGEIAERLEKSPTRFTLSPIEKLTDVPRAKISDAVWPELVAPVDLPKVTRGKTGVTVTQWAIDKRAEPEREAAELAFQKKQYDEAARHYLAALKIDPRAYILRAYVGDTYLFGSKDPAKAVEQYDQAIALNPDDYRLYFFRANAYRHLQKKDESLADLRRSLVLKPRNSILIGALQKAAGTMGRIEPDLFVPRAIARRDGDGFVIYADVERGAEWLAWGNCKALWLADAPHREEMVGSKAEGWSTVEEIECLGSLLSVYEARRDSGEGMTDDRLDRLLTVADDGLLSAFVVYEMGSRVDPQIVLKLEPAFRKDVERYVEKYVLTAPE